jgi:hypothetical protein
MAGLAAESHVFGVTLPRTTLSDGKVLIEKLGTMNDLTSTDVADFVQNVCEGKFADYVPDALARAQWANRNVKMVKDIPAMARSTLT